MSPDLPYLIPLAGTGVLVILYFTIRSWNYGILRPIVSTLSVFAGAAVAWYVFHNSGPFFEWIRFDANFRATLGVAMLTGLLVLLLARRFGHATSESICAPGTFAGRLLAGPCGAFLSLIPALLLLSNLAAGLRTYATFAELRYIDTCLDLYAKGEATFPDTPYVVKLRDGIEMIPRATEVLDRVDPYSPAPRRHLVGLALIGGSYDLYLAVGRNKTALEIYSHPRVTELLGALPITRFLADRDHRSLLTNESIIETSELPELTENLTNIDVVEILQGVLGMP